MFVFCFHFSELVMQSHAGTTEISVIDEIGKFLKYAKEELLGQAVQKEIVYYISCQIKIYY